MKKSDSDRLSRISQLERMYKDDCEDRYDSCYDGPREYSKFRKKEPRYSVMFSILIGLSGGMMLGNLCSAHESTFEPFGMAMVSPAFIPAGSSESQVHTSMQNGIVNVSDSLITGIVDSEHQTASLYWTLKLKNNEGQDREARISIDLPEGSAISRATLWINGVPQEATFDAKGKVEAAYDYIVVKHRDPLLVKQIGPNKVQVLAAPVSANGGEMQLRIGLTAPVNKVDGVTSLQMPSIAESNLHFDKKQNIHLTSKDPLSGTGQVENTGIYTLRATLPIEDMKNAKVNVPEQSTREFATRLTHTNPPEYVVAKRVDGRLSLKRTTAPDCPVVKDEDLAFRLSNLWAHQEIEWQAQQGNVKQACDLANIYRIVSSVSSAAVLEQESDYSRFNLNRNRYQNIQSSADSTSAISMPSIPFFGTARSAELFDSQSDTNSLSAPVQNTGNYTGSQTQSGGSSSLPVLQGATNGTIGPQGVDATVIQGMNANGIVRIDNGVQQYRLLSQIFQFACYALALFFCSELVRNRAGQLSQNKGTILWIVSFTAMGLGLPSLIACLLHFFA